MTAIQLLCRVRLAGGVTLGVIGLFCAPWPWTNAAAACTSLPSTLGTAGFTINVPADGTYRFWAHILGSSANNNGVYVQLDNQYCQVSIGHDATIAAGQFTWVDYQKTPANKINMTLAAGNHAFVLAGLD